MLWVKTYCVRDFFEGGRDHACFFKRGVEELCND